MECASKNYFNNCQKFSENFKETYILTRSVASSEQSSERTPRCTQSEKSLTSDSNWAYQFWNYESSEVLPYPSPENMQSILGILEAPFYAGNDIESSLSRSYLLQLKEEFTKAKDKTPYGVVFRSILINFEILRMILSDNYYLAFFEALEHDPSVSCPNYTNTLNEARLNNCLDIQDPCLIYNIHLAIRIDFLKKSPSFQLIANQNVINSFEIDLWESILKAYLGSYSLQQALKSLLSKHSFEGFGFFFELFRLAKGVSLETKEKVFESFMGDLDCISTHLYFSDWDPPAQEWLRSSFRLLIYEMYRTSPHTMKRYLLNDLYRQDTPIVMHFCRQAFGLALLELSELFYLFVQEGGTLSDLIYDNFLGVAVQKMSSAEKTWTEEVLKLVVLCAKDTDKIRGLVLANDLLGKMMELDRRLLVFPVKFIRTVVLKQDSKLIKFFIQKNFLQRVLDLWDEENEDIVFSAIYSMLCSFAKVKNYSLSMYLVGVLPMLPNRLFELCEGLINECYANITSSPPKKLKLKKNCNYIDIESLEFPCKKQNCV